MKKTPNATLRRYPIYLKALRKIKEEGKDKIMSSELAEYVNIKSTTIRRDFSLIGCLGKQGYGYNVQELIDIFAEELGVNYDEKIVAQNNKLHDVNSSLLIGKLAEDDIIKRRKN